MAAIRLSSINTTSSTGKTAGLKGSYGTPSILILIDGTSAPFADNLVSQGRTGGLQVSKQVAWEIEKDLRAFDFLNELEDDNDESKFISLSHFYL